MEVEEGTAACLPLVMVESPPVTGLAEAICPVLEAGFSFELIELVARTGAIEAALPGAWRCSVRATFDDGYIGCQAAE